jgi:SAM-dependent methyltransferase
LIRHLRALPGARLVASDVRADAIEWCRDSLPGIEFHVNELEPPLAFLETDSVDLAIAQSVFTHIPLVWQRAWLEEIARVIRPGGIFWCTIIGRHLVDGMLDEDARRRLEETGAFELDGKNSRSSYSTQLIGSWDVFQTEPVVRREFGRYFEIADYHENPAGLDVLVMRVPPLG